MCSFVLILNNKAKTMNFFVHYSLHGLSFIFLLYFVLRFFKRDISVAVMLSHLQNSKNNMKGIVIKS